MVQDINQAFNLFLFCFILAHGYLIGPESLVGQTIFSYTEFPVKFFVKNQLLTYVSIPLTLIYL